MQLVATEELSEAFRKCLFMSCIMNRKQQKSFSLNQSEADSSPHFLIHHTASQFRVRTNHLTHRRLLGHQPFSLFIEQVVRSQKNKMVSFSKAVLLLSVVASANAFAPSPFVVQTSRTAVFMAEEAVEVEEEVAVPAAPARTPSGMELRAFRKKLKSFTAENFSQTLSDIEPFLLNDAGSSLYTKSMSRIATQANFLGQKVPEGYAKDAAATEKRRAKQDAFIKMKEEERIAAEAEAAEAAAEAAEAEDAATDEAATDEAAETVEAADETVEEAEPVMA